MIHMNNEPNSFNIVQDDDYIIISFQPLLTKNILYGRTLSQGYQCKRLQ